MKGPAYILWAGCLLFHAAAYAQMDTFDRARNAMVKEQIERRGIVDTRVLNAMRKVKRHLFVDAAMKPFAYEDRPLPIGYGQTISQPYIVAYMTRVAELDPGDRVLEIGTGSGYQTAVIAEMADKVYTVEILKPLADTAEKRLKELGYKNIRVRHGDGYNGWLEYAPFDKIIVTAAPADIPKNLIRQLKIGGRMIIPVGLGAQNLYLITKTENGYKKENLMPVSFVPMLRSGKE